MFIHGLGGYNQFFYFFAVNKRKKYSLKYVHIEIRKAISISYNVILMLFIDIVLQSVSAAMRLNNIYD